MSWRVELQPRARREMQTAARWYEGKEKGLGKQFLGEVKAVRQWLATMPERYQAWPDDPHYRRAVVDVFPFVVLYRVDEKRHAVIIAAVAHTHRRPGYWRGRR